MLRSRPISPLDLLLGFIFGILLFSEGATLSSEGNGNPALLQLFFAPSLLFTLTFLRILFFPSCFIQYIIYSAIISCMHKSNYSIRTYFVLFFIHFACYAYYVALHDLYFTRDWQNAISSHTTLSILSLMTFIAYHLLCIRKIFKPLTNINNDANCA